MFTSSTKFLHIIRNFWFYVAILFFSKLISITHSKGDKRSSTVCLQNDPAIVGRRSTDSQQLQQQHGPRPFLSLLHLALIPNSGFASYHSNDAEKPFSLYIYYIFTLYSTLFSFHTHREWLFFFCIFIQAQMWTTIDLPQNMSSQTHTIRF